MSKYIDADILRKKIAEQMDSLPREVGRGAGTITSTGYGMMQAFQIVRTILDSLQQEQPEVDLEKEIEKLDDIFYDLDGVAIAGTSTYLDMDTLKYIARQFYELGLNTRKEIIL